MPNLAKLTISAKSGVPVLPRIYGHFAEHLGRCCYDGLWVGLGSSIPNVGGFRTDIVEALTAMGVPLLRWPGGCYADHYHWRDGIGEPESRPRRLGLSCGLSVADDNGLGTHEFLRFCALIGAEPYLAGNMGSGSVQELCDWVEYCNSEVDTTLVRERRKNGATSAFNVRLWGVSNENWGCGGCYDPESYGLEYRRYASMIKHVDSKTELVVCGHEEEWNRRLIPVLASHANLVDHYSIHRYWSKGGHGTDFTESHYYASIAEAGATEDFILETRKLLDQIDPKRRIGIALDEWGIWHADARTWGPDALGDSSCEYAQASTMRDAMLAAVGLEAFHRQAEHLSMANLAQIVNVLHAPIQTQGEQMWLTPTYHLLKMHRVHFGQERVACSVDGAGSLPNGLPAVSALATDGSNGFQITVLNRSFDQSCQLAIPDWAKRATLLAAPSANAMNSAARPDLVAPKELEIGPIIELPPCAILAVSA